MSSTDRSAWRAPVQLLCGLTLFGLSFATWGVGTEGVQPSVSGLGRVSVPGASAGDVEFLQEYTGRPGLVTMVLGAVIVIAAAMAWWRTELRTAGAVVVSVAALAATAWTVVTLLSLESHLFDARVTEAIGPESAVLRSGWGLLASIAIALVCLMVASATVVMRLASPPVETL